MTEKQEQTSTGSDLRALGICAECIDRALCTQRRTWVGPVFYCEEYRDQTAAEARKPRLRPVADVAEAAPVAQTKLTGLCVNCARRDECMFTKPEGGVWHCEEYA